MRLFTFYLALKMYLKELLRQRERDGLKLGASSSSPTWVVLWLSQAFDRGWMGSGAVGRELLPRRWRCWCMSHHGTQPDGLYF